MHILFLNPGAQLGGAEVALLDMLASLRDAEPEWKLSLVVSADGPLIAKAKALGVDARVVRFPRSISRLGDSALRGPAGQQQSRLALKAGMVLAAPTTLAYVRKLRRAIHDARPDVVHTNGFKMHVLGAWATPQSVPLIWHIHDYVSCRPLMARLLRRYAHRCALAFANSESVAADLKTVCGSELAVRTIHNGIDLERFSPVGATLDLDALSSLPPAGADTIRVGMLATFARWKGHETLLRALSLLPPDLPVRGYIIGDALYETDGSQYSRSELESLAQELGVTNRVGFTGFVPEPAATMRTLDIVVHASTDPEPFGLVIVEAMACGRAVIVSNAGGATELIENNVNALVHAPGDAEQLARAITELATNFELRTRLGAHARATAELRFNRARFATELIPIYQLAQGQSLASELGKNTTRLDAEYEELRG